MKTSSLTVELCSKIEISASIIYRGIKIRRTSLGSSLVTIKFIPVRFVATILFPYFNINSIIHFSPMEKNYAEMLLLIEMKTKTVFLFEQLRRAQKGPSMRGNKYQRRRQSTTESPDGRVPIPRRRSKMDTD